MMLVGGSLLPQIDLIDMRHRPDGTFKWIGHYMDHWAKFHVLFPQMRKSAAEVALNLQNQVFAVLGIPGFCTQTMGESS